MFAKFENSISQISSRYKVPILMLSGILLLCLCLSILLGLICIPTTMGMAEQNMINRSSAYLSSTAPDYVSDEEMDNWNNVVTPVAKFLYGYLGNAVVVISGAYVAICCYFLSRWIYRMRKKQQEVVIE